MESVHPLARAPSAAQKSINVGPEFCARVIDPKQRIVPTFFEFALTCDHGFSAQVAIVVCSMGVLFYMRGITFPIVALDQRARRNHRRKIFKHQI